MRSAVGWVAAAVVGFGLLVWFFAALGEVPRAQAGPPAEPPSRLRWIERQWEGRSWVGIACDTATGNLLYVAGSIDGGPSIAVAYGGCK